MRGPNGYILPSSMSALIHHFVVPLPCRARGDPFGDAREQSQGGRKKRGSFCPILASPGGSCHGVTDEGPLTARFTFRGRRAGVVAPYE